MKELKPRDYQLDLIGRVRGQIARGNRRVLMQAPTGSGKTAMAAEIIRRAVAKGCRVLFLAHMRRLVTQPAKSFTNYGIPCGVIMAGVRPTPAPVQVASRDTLLSRGNLPPADVVFIDETRHVMADGYRALAEQYAGAVHIGLDATPARDDGRGLGDFYDAIECCAPTADLVRQGHLVPVKCYAPQIRTAGKRRVAGDPVTAWKAMAAGRPTAVFSSRVKESLAVCDAYNKAGIPAEHIDGTTPDDEREAIISRVESGRTLVVCSVATMTEGVDVPCLSCAQLLCLCESFAGYIQRVGRIRRPHPGKADAIVLDHADAVLDHGMPDDPVRWELEQSGPTVDARNKDDEKDGKRSTPVVCPSCGVIYAAAAVCPACGCALPKRMQPPKLKAQLLTEVENALTPDERRARRVAHWHECLRVMAYKGNTVAAAAGMFRSRYPEGPSDDFPNYPEGWQWRAKAADAFPQYLRRANVG